MANRSSNSKTFPSTATLILLGVAWGIVALLFYLLFSVPPPGEEQPAWFFIGITLLETGAFAVASLLCFRNWQSGQIVSGRNVWLWIGAGLVCYTLGNVLFYLWGNVWGQDPAVSLGDVFYLLSYVFLAGGMLQAVLPRRLNLEARQWVFVAIVGILGIFLAYFLNYRLAAAAPEETTPAPAETEQVAPATPAPTPSPQEDPEAAGTPSPTPAPEATAQAPEASATPAAEPATNAPAWVEQLDSQLEPFESFVSLLYVVGDCLLLVVAATLLVAFWGGRFSQSWTLIAIAAFCLYIADMFFAFYVSQASYQEGSLWEVFWTFSALFFGMGAVVEHAISTRSRRSSRRRRT